MQFELILKYIKQQKHSGSLWFLNMMPMHAINPDVAFMAASLAPEGRSDISKALPSI
jgi:hypothetical protein